MAGENFQDTSIIEKAEHLRHIAAVRDGEEAEYVFNPDGHQEVRVDRDHARQFGSALCAIYGPEVTGSYTKYGDQEIMVGSLFPPKTYDKDAL